MTEGTMGGKWEAEISRILPGVSSRQRHEILSLVTLAYKQGARLGELELLHAGEVALIFGVTPGTVNRWPAGKLPCVHTPGGRRRYRAADVRRLLLETCAEDKMPVPQFPGVMQLVPAEKETR